MNMPLNFGHKVEEKSFDNDVIPKDTLAWMVVNVRGFQNSKQTNGRYLDIELTVAENQPYAKRKIWDKIADPFDAQNSEEWRNMGYGAIRRILEAVKGATPDNPNSYVLNRLEDISGLVVPVLIGIEKGTKEYPDPKNRVDYLSPHSSVKKIVECYGLRQQGIFKYGKDEPATNDGQSSLFGSAPAPTTPAAMPPAATPPQQTQPAAGGAPGWLADQGQPAAAPAQPAANPPQGYPPAPGTPQSHTQGYEAAPANTGFPSGQPQPQPQQGQPGQYAASATSIPPTGSTTAPQSAPNATPSPSEGYAQPAQFPGTQGQ